MTTGERILWIVAWLWIAAPTLPILWAWSRILRHGPARSLRTRLAQVVLVLTTLSYLLIWLGLLRTDILGHDYSSRRFTTIYVNLALMGVATAVAAASESRLRIPVVLSGALTGSVWLYVAAINSVV